MLWAVPVLAGVWVWYRWWRSRTLNRLGVQRSLERMLPGWSGWRFALKNLLFMVAVSLLAVAWANPQRGAKKQTVKQKSADVIIALDISRSMLVEDVAPSRLERAKSFLRKLVEALQGERIGLVFFAGDAYLQMPLSVDYNAADMFISSASPELITAQGTAIPRAIDLATESFDPEPGGGRALILLTDGENHDEDAVRRAAQAYEDGIVILAVGAGTAAGGPIPMGVAGSGTLYKRDEAGEIVRSRLEFNLLREIARSGGGVAYRLTQDEAAISAIKREVDRLEKREMQVRSFTEFESYFQWFLLPAFLLLGLDAWQGWRAGNAPDPAKNKVEPS